MAPQFDATHPRPRSKPGESPIEGERRLATILFCDVQGSTAMAGKLDPEEWAELMDEAFDYLISPVVDYGGTVARLMGDGILAVFGAPVSHEDDPQRAVLAGLKILEKIQPFVEEIHASYRMTFNVRVGINTGMVIVGEIGTDQAAEWTAMGDAVNLAARMEQTAQPGTVQISEDTYRLIVPLFDFEPLGHIEVKGKSDPVLAYRVLRPKESPGRLRGIPGLEVPLIGRQSELAKLQEALVRLREGRGGIACLVGDAGLGKSRLIEELRAIWQQEIGEKQGWVEGRGISFESSRPYGLFRQYLLHHLDYLMNIEPELSGEGIGSHPTTAGQAAVTVQTEAPSAISVLLLAEEKEYTTESLEGESLKRQLFNEASRFFENLSATIPLVVVSDDLHWADPASIELLIHLFGQCEEAPILFLCAMRPMRQAPGWQVKQWAEQEFPHRYLEIQLGPLSEGESMDLVNGLLAISELPSELRRMILEKAEGNPFFVEEIIRNLIESKAIVREESGQRWRAAQRIDQIQIPDSIHALLAARIDRLEKDARPILQLASVVGRNFTVRVLEKVAGPAIPLGAQLNMLERMGMIWETARSPERTYSFRHELIRDAAYESILLRRRRQYHRLVGEAIESLYPDRLESSAHLLAMHFEKALDPERTLKYSMLAGDAALRLYANEEAIGHYRRAIQTALEIGTPDQLIHLHNSLGRALQNSGQATAALEVYRQLEALGESRQDDSLRLAGLIPQATLHSIPSSHFDYKQGSELSARALQLARQINDHSAEARSLWNMMLMEILGEGHAQTAVSYGEQALAITRQFGLREEQAYVLHDLGRVYMQLGRFSESAEVRREAQELWRTLENKGMLADSLGLETEARLLTAEFQAAEQAALEGTAISQAINNLWDESYNLMLLSFVYMEIGEFTKAFKATRQAQEKGKAANFKAAEFNTKFLYSWIYLLLGSPERGLETFQDVVHLRPERLLSFGPLLEVGLAFFRLQNGDIEGAKQILDRLTLPETVDDFDVVFSPFITYFICELSLAEGEAEKALSYAEKAIASREEHNLCSYLPDLYLEKGKALLSLNRGSEGFQALETARHIAEEMGSRRALWMIWPELLHAYEERGEVSQAQAARRQAGALARDFLAQIEDPRLAESFRRRYAYLLEPE